MTRSGWRYVLAALGLLTVAASKPEDSADPAKNKPAHQLESAAHPTVASPAVNAIEASKYHRPCREPQDNNACDLEAQWKAADAAEASADWAKWQTILSAFGAIGLLYSLYLNRKALKVTRQSFESDLRAYILVSGCGMTGQNQIGRVFDIEATNYGRTPAFDSEIKITAVLAEWEPQTDNLTGGFSKQRSGFVAAPTLPFTMEIVIPFEWFEQIVLPNGKITEGTTVILNGYIRYKDIYKRVQKTNVRLRLFRNEKHEFLFMPCASGNDAT